jgi:hypothetical protein
MNKIKRKRGGQPGNQNARKHGYYAACLDPQSRLDLKQAASLEGIDEEVALLRSQIIKASRSGDYRAIGPLLKALTVMEKLQDFKNKSEAYRREKVIKAVAYLGFILYDGWVNSGFPTGKDIKNFDESKRIEEVVAKGVGATDVKLVSARLG